MSLLSRFDHWVAQGPFTSRDLAIYRVIYSCWALLILGDISWLANYPDALYRPPPGPFQLLHGFPPSWALITLEICRSASLVLLGVGFRTKLMSLLVPVFLIATFGFTYSIGKVSHSILMIVVPAALSFSNWGAKFSVDSLIAARRGVTGPEATPQWPVRTLALAVGLAFAAAATAKLMTGWLDWSAQSTRGYFLRLHFADGATSLLANAAVKLDNAMLWESLDWFTVIFEFAFLLALPSWTAFRGVVAVATLFHLGVFLLFDIRFGPNLITYAAFVSWGALLGSYRPSADRRSSTVSMCLGVVVIGVGTTLLVLTQRDGVLSPVGPVMILISAAMGLAYLTHLAREVARRASPPQGTNASPTL